MQLSEVLRLFDSPISQEQCWSICYGACQMLCSRRREDYQRRERIKYILNFDSLILTQRGEIEIMQSEPYYGAPQRDSELIYTLGNLICRCLDYGLDDVQMNDVIFNDDLAELIGGMVLQSVELDEGIGDSDSLAESWESKRFTDHRNFKALIEVSRFCLDRLRLRNVSERERHYVNVCKALYIEASELKAFLGYVLNDYTLDSLEPLKDSQQRAKQYVQGWSKLWLRVMNELRQTAGNRDGILSVGDYRYVTYDMIPANLNVDSAMESDEHLPVDAKERIFDFLKNRVSTNANKEALSKSQELDTESLSEILPEDAVDCKMKKIVLEDSLLKKLNSWDDSSSDDLLNDANSKLKKLKLISDLSYDDLPPKERVRSKSLGNLSQFKSCLETDADEIDISREGVQDKIGASLTEIFKIRQEITRSEIEYSVDQELLNGRKCFACRRNKFNFFNRARTCMVCSRQHCLKCMKLKMRIPAALFNSVPPNIDVAYRNDKPRRLSTSIYTSMIDLRENMLSGDILRNTRNTGALRLNVCVHCKDFLESIEDERKKSEWTVQLELDL